MQSTGRMILRALLVLCLSVNLSSADIRLPSLIGDNMVLQQGGICRLWGWADADEAIAIKPSWLDNGLETKAGSDGRWQIKVTAPPTGGPYTIVLQGKNKITLSNILCGEVWIASGQSNMKWPLSRSENGEKHTAEANHPHLRLFHVSRTPALEPQENCEGQWLASTPQSAESFSAVGYFFGRDIHQKLNVPIGIIETAWGGTPAQTWTRKEMLASRLELQSYLSEFEQLQQEYPEKLAKYEEELAKWKQKDQEAKENNSKTPNKPWPPHAPLSAQNPSILYNGMIAPLVNFTIKGAIWYQGEANVRDPEIYHPLFSTMIENWRQDWGQGQFPFYFVQIAPYERYRPVVACALLQEAQFKTFRTVANTGMVVVSDIGNIKDIHPRNKLDVGKRLARWAMSETYRLNDIIPSGPLYSHYLVEDEYIRIYFDYARTGLECRGKELTHFAIAGADRKFKPARAVIDGQTVLVSHPEIKHPLAVRFAFTNNAEPNLFNGIGLPAGPFRTDEWPVNWE